MKNKDSLRQLFWKTKSLHQLTEEEWESLCDGCGRCCLHKLEDKDTGEICYTNVACRLLDIDECRCSDYENRSDLVPECIQLTVDSISQYQWLPDTCAYRRLAEGRTLPSFHFLVSGNPEAVHEVGASIQYKAISENDVDTSNLEPYVMD